MRRQDDVDRGGRGADGAGIVLRLSPLHARPKDDDQQQRDQAGQHARTAPASRSSKRYVVDGQAFYYRNAQHPGAPIKDVVQVYYQFKNEETAGLGMPMPAGVVRVYQADSKGGVQFVGEDRIDHTPKDETLNLKIGNAFDVVCERKQTDFEKIADQRLRDRIRDHAAQPQGDADHGRSERAGRRHVADAALVARVDEDRRVGGAIQGPGGARRGRDAEISPRQGHVLIGSQACDDGRDMTLRPGFIVAAISLPLVAAMSRRIALATVDAARRLRRVGDAASAATRRPTNAGRRRRMANVVRDPKAASRRGAAGLLEGRIRCSPSSCDDVAFVYGSKWKQRYFKQVRQRLLSAARAVGRHATACGGRMHRAAEHRLVGARTIPPTTCKRPTGSAVRRLPLGELRREDQAA